jgi:hypothetical protein
MRPLRVLLGVLAGLAVLGGCATGSAEPTSSDDDVTGSWGASTVVGEASLDLAEDGSATGSDGCNRMVGEWTRSTEGVSFSAWSTTRMSCPAVDPWLSLAVAGRLEGGQLVLVDKDAVQLGTLDRTEPS